MKFLDLRKLLPASQRDKPAEAFVRGFQAMLEEFNDERVALLKNSIRFDLMNQENVENYIYKLGYTLSSGDGYTSDLQYFKRELQTIIDRLTSKCADFSYENIYYIYNFTGNTYPLLAYDSDEDTVYMEPWIEWKEYTGLQTDEAYTLDNGYEDNGNNPSFPLDPAQELDSEVDDLGAPISGETFTYLDTPFTFYGLSTRHFLLSYTPLEIASNGKLIAENAQEFSSDATLRSFYNNVQQFKRLIEIPHFEFDLRIRVGDAGNDEIVECVDYNGQSFSPVVNMFSRLFTGRDISDVRKMQFGTGAHADGDITGEVLTGCETPVDISTLTGLSVDGSFRTSTNDWIVMLISSDEFRSRNYPTVVMKFPAFSEICFFDASNNVIAYSKFPWVQFYDLMLSSVFVELYKV